MMNLYITSNTRAMPRLRRFCSLYDNVSKKITFSSIEYSCFGIIFCIYIGLY